MRFSARPLVFVVLCAALCASGAYGALKPADTWKKFTPPTGNFTVKLPAVPKTSTQSADQPLGGHIAMTIYSLTAAGNIFLVEDAALDKGSPALGDAQGMLSGVERGMAGSTQSKVVSSTRTTIQGFPAHRMVLQGMITTKGITLLAGNHCYTVVIATKASQINQAILDKFVNSFKVLKR